MSANESEVRRWNDDYWTSVWPKRERLTTEVTPFLLSALEPADAERVLDVGPGGGLATLEIARRVGSGEVVGVDVSTALTALATSRAAERHVANARFVVLDAQEHDAPDGPYDAVASQFGVMFFDEPARAFSRLRASTSPGGRLAFACWRGAELNPWFTGPALSSFVEPPPEPAAGKSPTGPFSLADRDATTAMLLGAGWIDVQVEPHDLVVRIERDTLLDDGMMHFIGVADEDLDAALAAADAHLDQLAVGDGRYDAPLAFQVVTATNPR